jgi:hypothetical protein
VQFEKCFLEQKMKPKNDYSFSAHLLLYFSTMKTNLNKIFLLSPSELLKLMLFCGLIQIGAYYFVGAMASPTNHIALPQPDTILYCQAARQIAEGQPFIFSPGDKPSTGTTSHLYPFLLAIPYALGATGDDLITAGFALNAAFYLLFILSWGTIAIRLCKTPLARGVAGLLLALNGQAAIGAFSQSDTGLFMAISSALFASFLSGRMKTFAFLLVIAPWCRPEGSVLAFLFPLFLLIRRLFWKESSSKGEWITALLGVFSALGVPFFNLWLTGTAQFHSILYKGYFKQYDFLPSIFLSSKDAIRMLREFFLGTPETAPREFFFLPLFGAIFAWIGIWRRPWLHKSSWRELWWLAAILVALGGVATSGWQNTNLDRYLAWVFPLWMIYVAEGATWLTRKIEAAPRFRSLPLWALLGFQSVTTLWMLCCFDFNSQVSNHEYEALKTLNTLLPPKASVGTLIAPAYAIPGHRLMHLNGLYSPDFLVADSDLPANFEKIKHHQEYQFDYWLIEPIITSFIGSKTNVFYPSKNPITLDDRFLAKADWSALKRSMEPLEPASLKAIQGWKEIARLDIGYIENEKRFDYSSFSRFYKVHYYPQLHTGMCGTNLIADVGRAIIGSESMTIPCTPRQKLKILLRTMSTVNLRLRNGPSQGSYNFGFNSPLKLRIHVDEKEACYFEIPIKEEKEVFSEINFEIPAEAITQPNPRITLYGDHASFALWFYQPDPSPTQPTTP